MQAKESYQEDSNMGNQKTYDVPPCDFVGLAVLESDSVRIEGLLRFVIYNFVAKLVDEIDFTVAHVCK